MRVIHILKDGSIVDDIAGRVVKERDARPVYKLIHQINEEVAKNERVKRGR